MRAFPDLKSREKMRDEFYEGELWKEELEHKLMPILEQYDVVVVDAKEGPRRLAVGRSRNQPQVSGRGVLPSSTSCRSTQVWMSSRSSNPSRFFAAFKSALASSRQP